MSQPPPWGGPPRRGFPAWGWVVMALLAAGVIALLADGDWYADPFAVQRVLVVVLIGGTLAVVLARRLRGQFSAGLAYAAIWLGIVLALALAFVYRDAFRDARDRLTLAVMPAGANWVPGLVKIPRDASGHYRTTVLINGQPVSFLVDTGASGIALSAEDAARAGIDVRALTYSQRAMTAGGSVAVAPVRLDSVELGPIRFSGMAAVVTPTMRGTSLLGMSFLSRLSSFGVEDGYLVLRQ